MSNDTKTNGFNIELIWKINPTWKGDGGSRKPKAYFADESVRSAVVRKHNRNPDKGDRIGPKDKKNTVKLYKAESGPVRPVLRKCYSRVSGGGGVRGRGHSLVSYVVASRYE